MHIYMCPGLLRHLGGKKTSPTSRGSHFSQPKDCQNTSHAGMRYRLVKNPTGKDWSQQKHTPTSPTLVKNCRAAVLAEQKTASSLGRVSMPVAGVSSVQLLLSTMMYKILEMLHMLGVLGVRIVQTE